MKIIRLIDADDIVYDSIDSEDTNRHAYYYGTGIMAARKEDIDEMPTIELPERKNGHWILSDDRDWKTCSECGADVDVSMGLGIFVDNDEVSEMRFCPNCGARMVKEGGEHD